MSEIYPLHPVDQALLRAARRRMIKARTEKGTSPTSRQSPKDAEDGARRTAVS